MIGIIADDLSGADELGAIGLRHGLRAEILIAGAESDAKLIPAEFDADLACIDTDSRACDVAEAARRAGNAATALRNSGAKWVYKKVDSVLRGQVTAEIGAIAAVLQMRRALLSPANPSRGRVIRRGSYYINGTPIHETEFARDPEHPRRTSLVTELVAAPSQGGLHVRQVDDALPGSGVIIAEAGSEADVRAWAARMDNATLAAGAADFFATLLALRENLKPSAKGHAHYSPAGRELFVCGSTSDSAREFVRDARQAGTPVISLPAKLSQGAEFTADDARSLALRAVNGLQTHPRAILNVGLPLVENPDIARRLAGHLVQLAAEVLAIAKVDCVFAEGGATAVELARRMGWRRLTVAGELAPGVATLGIAGNEALRLILKPGSYDWPESIRHPRM